MKLFGLQLLKHSLYQQDIKDSYNLGLDHGDYLGIQKVVSDALPDGWLDPDKGHYWTGDGARLGQVHRKDEGCDISCVVHNPSEHVLRKFPTHWRGDRGIMERICDHGVGHPDPDNMKFFDRTRGEGHMEGVHGCDGCCMTPEQQEEHLGKSEATGRDPFFVGHNDEA